MVGLKFDSGSTRAQGFTMGVTEFKVITHMTQSFTLRVKGLKVRTTKYDSRSISGSKVRTRW